MSFARNSAGTLEIVDSNEYYPFGMNHLKTGNAFFGQGSFKNYKYNNKELQETGMYDFGARFYMPDIVRTPQIDPLAEKMPEWSFYSYAFNNPIRNNDPTGMEPEDVIDIDGESCCNGLKGFGLAVIDNITGGNLAQKYNDGSAAYSKGVLNGNVASGVA